MRRMACTFMDWFLAIIFSSGLINREMRSFLLMSLFNICLVIVRWDAPGSNATVDEMDHCDGLATGQHIFLHAPPTPGIIILSFCEHLPPSAYIIFLTYAAISFPCPSYCRSTG